MCEVFFKVNSKNNSVTDKFAINLGGSFWINYTILADLE